MVEIPVHDQEKVGILAQPVSREALTGLADAHTYGKGNLLSCVHQCKC